MNAACGGGADGALSIQAPALLQTSESGESFTVTAVLLSRPAFPVNVPVESSDETEGRATPSMLVFTPDNWNAPQTVTVRGANDALEDGSQTYVVHFGPSTSMDASFINLSAETGSIVNIDDETAGIAASVVSGGTTEALGAPATFTVRLRSQPIADVTLTLGSDDTSEGTIAPTTLTFTSVNWNAPQTVTVTGIDDALADGNIQYTVSSLAIASTDARYAALSIGMLATLTNTDNDSAGVTVETSPPMRTTEGGGTATFTVVLNAQPSSNVTIPLTSTNVSEGTVSPASLVFTSSDWASPKTVTVTGQPDALMDGTQPYQIAFGNATSGDAAYSGLPTPSVALTNVDEDTPGILVSTASGDTTEAGGTATFTIVLASPPSATVTMTVAVVGDEATVMGSAMRSFDSTNWNVPQTVTIQGADDAIVDGSQLYTVTIGSVTSADAGYNNLTPDPSSIMLTNIDNESPGFIVSVTTIATSEDAPGTATINVRLQTAAAIDVTFTVSSSDITEGTVSPSSLTFTAANWNVNQAITVTGANDLLDDGDLPYTVVFGAASSPGTGYDGLVPSSVDATNVDNDTTLIVRHSERCLDYFEADANMNTVDSEVVQRVCDGSPRQVWEFRNAGGGFYYVGSTSAVPSNANRCLSTIAAHTTSTDNWSFHRIQALTCQTTDRYKWRFIATTTAPWYQVQTLEGTAAGEGATRCLNVGNAATVGDFTLASLTSMDISHHIIRFACSTNGMPPTNQAWRHNLSFIP